MEYLEYSCKFRTEKCEYCHALVEVAFMEVHVKLFYCLFVVVVVVVVAVIVIF